MFYLPSKKDLKLFRQARSEALNAEMKNKHGSVITCGGKVVSCGSNVYNDIDPIFKQPCLGVHAEVSALSNIGRTQCIL